MADETYPAWIDFGACHEVIERDAHIMENLCQQGLSTDEATCQLMIFGLPSNRAPVPFLERDSIRRDDDVTALSELRTISLIRIASEADNLALAEIESPGMLMMSNYSRRCPAGIFRKKNKRLYTLPFFDGILDRLANVRATIHVAQYCWVQRKGRGAWAYQLSEVDSIHAAIICPLNSSCRERPITAHHERSSGPATGTSNSTNVHLTRQKSALFQSLAIPLWFPAGQDSVPTDSGVFRSQFCGREIR